MSKEDLCAELDVLRARVAELERIESVQQSSEEAPRRSEQEERLLGEQLAALVEITNELSMMGSVDDLCRRAVELARSRIVGKP